MYLIISSFKVTDYSFLQYLLLLFCGSFPFTRYGLLNRPENEDAEKGKTKIEKGN